MLKVHYVRSSPRHWLVLNTATGEIIADHIESREQADLQQARLLNPRLAAIAEAITLRAPDLRERALRAVNLAVEHPPIILEQTPTTVVFRCHSQTEEDLQYTVWRSHGHWHCECVDFWNEKAPLVHGQHICKHILACTLALKGAPDVQN